MSDQWDYEQRWFTIYLIRNRVNGKGYVGITIKALGGRLAEHIRDALEKKRYSANGRRYPLHAAIEKYGSHSFTIEELDRAYGLAEAQELETQYIKERNTFASGKGLRLGYNLSFGGEEPDLPYG
ncbi:MAG: GIY-YIG nuclease family protein [Dongiaceae bacterium]